MKKLLIALAAVIVSVASYAQGTVTFNTRIPGVLDAPVSIGSADGEGPGVKGGYTAGLFVQGAGGTLTPIPASFTPFRPVAAGGNPLLGKYVTTVSEVPVPGAATGGSATLVFRAWANSAGSFDAASPTQRGESAAFTVTGLGGGALPPANPVGITGFIIPVPEPTTLALGALGAAALLFRRRK
jgi:hypothetical protein